MHKLTKITPLIRRKIYYEFTNSNIEINNKEKLYKKVTKKSLSLKYNVHRNTISKIISRGNLGDFTVHKSTTNKVKTIEFGLKKLSKIEKKLEKRILRNEIKKTRYEKDLAGEMLHIDVFKIKNIKGEDPKKKKYLAGVIDDCTRLNYVEVISDKKASTLAMVMKKAKNKFKKDFGFNQIKTLLSDNGLEFTTHHKESRFKHKFEIQLDKLQISHRYTKVRRPQTNGKIERFWRIFNEEFFYKNDFKNWNDFEIKFKEYMEYYNKERPHGGINKMTPYEKMEQLKEEGKIYGIYGKNLNDEEDIKNVEKNILPV